ncbi:hypothetical protein LUZ60_012051 [Juncus effusus]|nr:hypothetical protein LUZ60_012051 [Juncus effusus]
MKAGLWECDICTYHNDPKSESCDICGVFQGPLCNVYKVKEIEVESRHRKHEASKMAKAIFNSNYQRIPKSAFNSFKFQNFSSFNPNHSVHIEPFKFDTPSPNDIVSTGLKSSRSFQRVDIKGKGKVENNLQEDKTESSFSEENTHHVAQNMKKLNLGPKKSVKKVRFKSEYKPEKWMLKNQENGSLNQLTLAIVGHIDSGKSRLCDKILHLLDQIPKNQMHKYEKASKEKGKGSFVSYEKETERGLTMAVSVKHFKSKNYHVVLLDSPGHQGFVPNLISRTAQADSAILVIDSSFDAFEEGLTGQTKEHTQIIRSFGVEQIIIAVNKLDTVNYAKERFDFVKSQLGPFLRSCGFKESRINWIPISAISNQNLIEFASDFHLSSWYKGQSLLEAIDSISVPNRDIDISKPLIIPICDIISSRNLGHVAVSGKLEAGAIRVGSKVMIMPTGAKGTIKTIEKNGINCNIARAGDNIGVGLQNIHEDQMTAGSVLCHPDFPVQIASALELKILALEISTRILVGSLVEFYVHHAKASATVKKIISLLDQKTGKAYKKAPQMISARQSGIIQVKLDREVCVEEFGSCRVLGRVFLRNSGCTIAVGIVNRILEQL